MFTNTLWQTGLKVGFIIKGTIIYMRKYEGKCGMAKGTWKNIISEGLS